jgi:hypothetical protein
MKKWTNGDPTKNEPDGCGPSTCPSCGKKNPGHATKCECGRALYAHGFYGDTYVGID